MKTTLENIVGEARELFRHRGYDGMSMQDLAERVGLKKPSLYTRFASKEALVPEVLALTLAETVDGLPDAEADWRAAYRTIVERIADTLSDRTRCVGGHLALGVSTETPVAQKAVTAFFEGLRDGIAATLRPGMDSASASVRATDTLLRLQGASVWLAATGDRAPMRRTVQTLLHELSAKVSDEQGRTPPRSKRRS